MIVECECGRRYQAPKTDRQRRFRCKECGSVLTVAANTPPVASRPVGQTAPSHALPPPPRAVQPPPIEPPPVAPPPAAIPVGTPVIAESPSVNRRSTGQGYSTRPRHPLVIVLLILAYGAAVAGACFLVYESKEEGVNEVGSAVIISVVGLALLGIVFLHLGTKTVGSPIEYELLTAAELAEEKAYYRREAKDNRARGAVGCVMGLCMIAIGVGLTFASAAIGEWMGGFGMILFWGMILSGFLTAGLGLLSMITGIKIGR